MPNSRYQWAIASDPESVTIACGVMRPPRRRRHGIDERRFRRNRLVFESADHFGALRPFASGEISFKIDDPGPIVGDNPFHLVSG
jgi:hypothetical protein